MWSRPPKVVRKEFLFDVRGPPPATNDRRDDRTAPPPPLRPTRPGMVVVRAAMDRFTRTMCTIERSLLAAAVAAAAGKGFRLQYPDAAAADDADDNDNRRNVSKPPGLLYY